MNQSPIPSPGRRRSAHGTWLVLLLLILPTAVRSLHRRPSASTALVGSSSAMPALSNTLAPRGSAPLLHISIAVLAELRGGDSEYDSEYDEEDEEDDDEEDGAAVEQSETNSSSVVLQVSKKIVSLTVKLCFKALKTTARVIEAAFDTEEETENATVLTTITGTIRRMFRAAFYPSSEADDSGEEPSPKKKEVAREETIEEEEDVPVSASDNARGADFGAYLSDAYQVEAGGETPVLGGPISDALRIARSKSRLLVVFIPCSRPGKGKGASADLEVVQSFLSAQVSTVAEKRARKKEKSGSFLLWSAKAGSPEAVVAMKRLKAQQVNNKGQKRPVLLVAYPSQRIDARGQPTVVPKLLAQHHCSPPPPPETMAAWLNALRKRHAKQFVAMQLAAKEAEYFKERKAGYKDSMKSDRDREAREKKAEEERAAKEKAEKERQEALQQRREELREMLPDEPDMDEADAVTISLRLSDGKSSRRRFSADTELSMVFNWADVSFEMDREAIVLTTMNGKMSFNWDDGDSLLADTGLGRMVGLRVTMKKEEDEADAEEEEEEEEEDES